VVVPPLKGERMRAFFEAMRSPRATRCAPGRAGNRCGMLPRNAANHLRVIMQAVLGLQPGPEMTDLEGIFERLLAAGRPSRYSIAILPFVPVKLLANSRWVPFFRQLRQLDDALYALIAHARRRQEPIGEGNVFADLLAHATTTASH